MNKFSLLFLFLPLLFVACSDEDSDNRLFAIRVIETPQEAEISIDDTDCYISINGFAQSISVSLVGDFDSFNISDGVAEWITISVEASTITLALSGFNDEDDVRNAAIGFTVFKGGESVSGRIIVHQYCLTLQDFLAQERKSIDYFLSSTEVIDNLPDDVFQIQYGLDAPYYKLDEGRVYMQVVEFTPGPAAVDGEQIYFSFKRYNLLTYMNNKGYFSEGDWSTMFERPSFILGSDSAMTTQWGTAIPLPIELGLPVNSTVNLVVASEAGLTMEINNVTPYLYSIRYIWGNN